MTSIRTRVEPLESLEFLLPRLLSDLPVSRGQIAVDQLQGVIEAGNREHIVFLTARDSADQPLSALIAIQQADRKQNTTDMATIVHAGLLEKSQPDSSKSLQSLAELFDQQMVARQVRFVQWATPVARDPLDSATIGSQMGFKLLASLDYLSVDINCVAVPPAPNLEFQTLSDPLKSHDFIKLIEETYAETKDCPKLNVYRTASDTVSGYESAQSYAPEYWFRVLSPDGADAGVLILGCHRSQTGTPPIIEIVYMGLVPAARGRAWGRQLIQKTFQVARDLSGERLILAVDQQNEPARSLYDAMGFVPMMSESVWAKSIC